MAAITTPTAAPSRSKPSKPWFMRKRLWLPVGLLAVFVIPVITADDPHRQDVSRKQFEERGLTWPLTVDAGELACPRGNWVIFTPDGTNTNYAANGLAKGAGFADLDPIWEADSHVNGLKVSAEDLTDAGLALC